eukprot:gene21610-25993_t
MACCGAEECKKNLQIFAESQEERNAKQAEAAVTGAAPQEALELEVSPEGEPAPAAVVEEPPITEGPAAGEPALAEVVVDPPPITGSPAAGEPALAEVVVEEPAITKGPAVGEPAPAEPLPPL